MKEKLSWREAERAVRAFRQEHGMSSDVDVATLATTLGTSEDEVRRLAGPNRRFVDRSGMLSAMLSLGVIAAAVLAIAPSLRIRRIAVKPRNARPASIFIIKDSEGRLRALDANDMRVAGPHPLEYWTNPVREQDTLSNPDEKTM